MRLLVTATNPEGSASAASTATATVAGDGPVNTIAPTISGSAQRAVALTSAPGTWSGNGNTLQLPVAARRPTVDIAGATGAGYELDRRRRRRDGAPARHRHQPRRQREPRQRRVRDRQGRAAGQHRAADGHRRALRATTLSASQGTWTGPALTYAYQWQRDSGAGFTDIAGATGTTYLLGVADVGKRIRVRVTATNADASVTATSIGSSVVLAGPPLRTSAPDDLRHARGGPPR